MTMVDVNVVGNKIVIGGQEHTIIEAAQVQRALAMAVVDVLARWTSEMEEIVKPPAEEQEGQ